MFKKTIVKKSVYYDSVKLMLVTREIKAMSGIEEVAVVMGTDLNKDALERTGLLTQEAGAATPTDLIVGVIGDSEAVVNDVMDGLDNLLNANTAGKSKEVYRPKSIETAVKMQPGTNLCLISIPGRYAKNTAMEALRNNLHVMLFSDNVTLEEELEMKTYARKKGLLVMGPDCGTAMINGIPLCFANVIRKGDIGIVAASGTGAQEVMTLIHKQGGGVSQVIGTGGRDLKEDIGGITFLQALEALNEDPNTKIITLISKPPAKSVADKILTYLKEQVKKPVVINFLGSKEQGTQGNLHFAPTLEEAALRSVKLAGAVGEEFSFGDDLKGISGTEAGKIRETGKYIRGLFSGGTLAGEAVLTLEEMLGSVNSNLNGAKTVTDCFAMAGNACVDLGDDEYTVGRAHPMIDPTLRAEVFRAELQNPETAVILLDLVLGYGANMTPEKDLMEELRKFHSAGKKGPCVVASLCGSEDDPQDFAGIKEAMEELGVVIMPSNRKASQLAAEIVQRING